MKNSYHGCGTFGSKQDGSRDCHHLLWPRADWSSGAAYLLRNDPYFRLFVPKRTLHRQVHRLITNIPVPPLEICHDIEERLYFAHKNDRINVLKDSPQRRLNFLIHLLQNSAPDTVAALERELALFEDYSKCHQCHQDTVRQRTPTSIQVVAYA